MRHYHVAPSISYREPKQQQLYKFSSLHQTNNEFCTNSFFQLGAVRCSKTKVYMLLRGVLWRLIYTQCVSIVRHQMSAFPQFVGTRSAVLLSFWKVNEDHSFMSLFTCFTNRCQTCRRLPFLPPLSSALVLRTL